MISRSPRRNGDRFSNILYIYIYIFEIIDRRSFGRVRSYFSFRQFLVPLFSPFFFPFLFISLFPFTLSISDFNATTVRCFARPWLVRNTATSFCGVSKPRVTVRIDFSFTERAER